MILAHMMKIDQYALQCDFAETYHIYDYKALPLSKVALFSAGLRHDSRIMMKLSGSKITIEEALLASTVDRLSILVWEKTKDGKKNRNRPKSILEKLTEEPEKKKKVKGFNSGKEFDEYRKKLIKKYEKGGK